MQHAARKPASPQKFRKMSWLEVRNASCGTQPMSPAKAMVLYKQPKGVKPFKAEKHSRFSIAGSHLLSVRTLTEQCGMNHEEAANAKDLPMRRAMSLRTDVQLGGVEDRFDGPNTHFVKPAGLDVESCGLSHEEVMRAMDLPERKASSFKAALGGCEERFEGPHTHYVKSQGADHMLGQPALEITPAAVTIPKNNWLKNLWAVAGTALEDREMQKCDAIVAPTLLPHQDFKSQGSVVVKMSATSGPRYTYQRRTAAAALGGYTSHEMQWRTKGQPTMRTEKHSRFSTHGSHLQKKH